MAYDYSAKKIVAVIASKLEAGVALNVLGHLAVALGAHADDDLMGRPELIDASGILHIGISKYPVIVTKVKQGRLRRLIEDARGIEEVFLVDYPNQMLETGHDDELASAIQRTPESSIEYLGAILFGPSPAVTELTGKFTLWK